MKSAGFTLIELIVTIAIFAALAGIGGYSYLGGLPERRVAAACRDLYAAIHEARSEAVRRCADVSIVFDPGRGRCTIRDAGGNPLKPPLVLPGHVEICEATGNDGEGEGKVVYTFNSRGMKYPPSGKVKIAYHKPGYRKMGVRVTSAGGIAVIDETGGAW